MIVDTLVDVKSNIANSRDFKISDNSTHLFRMLSDFLYSNKEMCVLHELCANGVDEHKRFGIPETPIEIIAPTALEPKLTIRDFGEGLTEDMVYHLLTTYGESGEHKRKSNEFFGAWGIGSKSVAAVTKTWEVKSYHHGTASFYVVFINERGIPTITKTHSEPTDKSGLEIIIPIAKDNHYKWTNLFSDVFKYYDVKPSIKNYKVNYPVTTYSLIATGWKRVNSGVGSNSVAITNYRAYTLDQYKLKNEMHDPRAKKMAELGGFHLFFKTGDLELSLSREVLQYTKHSVASIEKKLIAIYDEYRTMFLADLTAANATNSLEYRVALRNVSKKYFSSSYSHITRNFVDEYIKGNKFNVSFDGIDNFTLSGIDGMNVKAKVARSGMVKYVTKSFTCWKNYAVRLDSLNKEVTIKIAYLDELKIVRANVRDTDARIRHHTKNQSGMMLILPATYNIPADLMKWVTKGSDYEKAPRGPRAPRGSRKAAIESQVYRLYKNSFTKVDDAKNSLAGQKCVYFRFKDARTIDSVVKDWQGETFWVLVDLLRTSGYTLLGLKENTKAPKWMKSVTEVAEEWLTKTSISDIEKAHEKDSFTTTSLNYFMTMKLTAPAGSVLEKAQEYYQYVTSLKSGGRDLASDYIMYCKLVGKAPKTFVKKNVWGEHTKACLDKYPLLAYISNSWDKPRANLVQDYINLVEGV